MKYKVELTRNEIEQIIWELGQGIFGDNSAYDRKLSRIKNKFEEILK